MSWSCNTVIPKGQGIHEIERALLELKPAGNDDCPEERRAAHSTAVQAAVKVLDHGGLGEPGEHEWYVILSGHCNPGNKPREGGSNDCVTVSVTQK